MSRLPFFVLALLALGGMLSPAENLALLRDSAVVTAQTLHGDVPVTLVPVMPAREITAIILSDTLLPGEITQVRRSLLATFPGAHTLDISSGGDPRALLSALCGAANGLPSNWAQTIIIGRLSTAGPEDAWLTAWLTEVYTAQRTRVSFWSIDGSAPAWAQNVSAATSGTVAVSGLSALHTPASNRSFSFFEASWDNNLKAGAWPYTAVLKNGAGERVAAMQTMMRAREFTPSLSAYLAARTEMQRADSNDAEVARKTLEQNPEDVDAIRRLAVISSHQNRAKESAVLWRQLTGVTPNDGAAWAEFGVESYKAGSYADAEQALLQAGVLGVKNRATLETQARLRMRRNDFADALAPLDEALAVDKNSQGLWLLRADCNAALHRWPAQAEALQHALALGPAPIERSTELITGYFAAGEPERALPYLESATNKLPPEASTRAQYAAFWEQLHNPAAESLWKSALTADAKFEPAYAGLAQHYLDHRRPADALRIANAGLDAEPGSLRLLLAKESALESLGDWYGARRLLRERAKMAGSHIEFLKRRARLEDYYGSGGASAYLALLNALLDSGSPRVEVIETCRRGLLVALRTESFDAAESFARKMAAVGDRSGLDLLERKRRSADSRIDLLGGSDALHFLMLGNPQSNPERILVDYSRALNSSVSDLAAQAIKPAWQRTGAVIHEYFAHLAALAALGERKPSRVEVRLSLKTKADKQRTEKAFGILGLKLKKSKGAITVESAEGKAQAKKQDVLAALAIDQESIQQALAAGKPYILKIPLDSVPIFPPVDLWQNGFYEHEHYAGGFAEALASDIRLPQLYLALNSMDRAAAEALVTALPLHTLADRFSVPLQMYSAALVLRGSRAEVPGGPAAEGVWQQLVGASPAKAVPFFEALLSRDDGRLAAFFYTLSQIDPAHQTFFTRSPARAKRFYDLFRESSEMRRGAERRLASSSFLEFLRGVPLNEDGSVDFPGAPEVWMVAKGHNAAETSVAKMKRKLRRTAAPDDEDAILIRLANTEYKTEHREQSELANFIAVSRLDAERDEPMDSNTALLLAQGYSSFGGLYPYFSELGDLEAADYRNAFSIATKIESFDMVTANTLLGEWHAFLALLAILRESRLAPPNDVDRLYRKGAERFANARNEAEWAIASLKAVDDLAERAAPNLKSRDAGILTLLLGPGHSESAYRQVLALQKAPSFDVLLAIRNSIVEARSRPSGLDEADRALATFGVLAPPKAWKITSDQKKNLEKYRTADAHSILLKLRAALAKRKRNANEIEKLSTEFMGALNPWTELAMAGVIYARYLEPSDLLVSEDPLLLRKHEFVGLTIRSGKPFWFTAANLAVSSEEEGSYFVGGLAEFSLAAGRARAAGNHLGGAGGEAFAAAVLASVDATDWRGTTEADLESFGSSVRLAREWIVESALSPAMQIELEKESRGLLSLTRRKSMLEGIERRDWAAVWESLSVSDLHFLGDALARHAPQELWTSSHVLLAMKQSSVHVRELDVLGPVAPDLNGCAQTRLRRYEPYEEYQRHASPDRLAERLAEIKLYLAWLADQSAWPVESLAVLASPATSTLVSGVAMRDMWDWQGALDSFRRLKSEKLEALLKLQ